LAGPECPAVTDGGQLGDGAAFSYVISLPGASCPATPIAAEDAIDATLARCVTATGTVQGVRRRVQARLALDDSPPFFKYAGLVGSDSVTMQPNATIGTAEKRVNVGSNVSISLNNGVNVWGDAMLGPAAPPPGFTANGGMLHGSQRTLADKFELELDHEFAKAKTSPPNSNGLLPTSVYTAATRSFRLSSGTYTLPAVSPGPTIYHFCTFDLAEGTQLRIPSGSEVRIYIDSTTPCAGSSAVTFRKSVCVNFSDCSGTMGTPETASLLKFYLAGAASLSFEQNSKVSGVFFAPGRPADFKPNVRLNGALAAKSVDVFPGLVLTWPEDSKQAIHGEDQTSRNGWFECRPEPDASSPGDPESGCPKTSG
jgi:hypothetical protein